MTDVGRVREHNEDAVLAQDPLFVLADGVGGAAAGEVASATALSVLAAAMPELTAADDTPAALRQAFQDANDAIVQMQSDTPERAGMGTTCTTALVDGSRVTIAHIGDSRAYRIAAGTIEQLTDDHSLVGDLVRSGHLRPEEASRHPQRNVITRAMGTPGEIETDVLALEARPGDWFLLCSDGLTDTVDDATIARVVSDSPRPDDAARELIRRANENGGTDNISVVLVQPLAGEATPVTPATPAAAATSAPRPRSSGGYRNAVIGLVIVLAVVASGVFVWSRSYFLTERSDGHIGIDRGFPSIGLSTEHSTSTLLVADIPQFEQDRLLDHPSVMSLGEANRTIDQLRTDATHDTGDGATATTSTTQDAPTP